MLFARLSDANESVVGATDAAGDGDGDVTVAAAALCPFLVICATACGRGDAGMGARA